MAPVVDSRRSKQFIDNLIEKLERYEDYVENQLPTAKANHIQHRLSALNESFSVYKRMLPPYEVMDTELLTAGIRTKIEESYISIVSDLEEKLDELKELRRKAQANETKPLNPLPVTIGAKLPTVELPTFSGGYLEWNSFIGTFDAIIHDNPSLSERTKFQYLKLSIDGVAAGAVAAVELSDQNYEIARQILKDRFDKPNFICEQHVHALFSYKGIDRPDSNKLLGLVDHFRSHLRSLEALKRPVKQWDDVMVYLMISKLDADTKGKWSNAAPSTHLPTMDDLCNFLSARAHRIHNEPKFTQVVSTPTKPVVKPNPRSNRPPATSLNVTKPPKFYCVHCQISGHTIVRCHKFLHMPIEQRHNVVTRSKLCYNCLRSDHAVDACPVTLRCRHCNSSHHSLLHKDAEGVQRSITNPEPPYIHSKALNTSVNKQSEQQTNNAAISVALSLTKPKSKPKSRSFIYLATALVNVIDQDGHHIVGRALLDSGSQLNFMTESFSALLKLPRRQSGSRIHGIGANVISSLSSSTITVKSNTTNFYTTLEVQVLPKITSYQPINPVENIESWEIPSNIQLADPEFFKPKDIDLLFGAEIYHQLLAVGQIQLADHLPLLQNTLLGWIVSGKASIASKSKHFCHLAGDNSVFLSEQIERFWAIENLPQSVKPLSSEESECEEHFTKFTKRDHEGRFIVKIPFLSCPSHLGDSKDLATRRFFNLEKRLHKSPELLNSYTKFIDEYKALGHMEPVDPKTIDHPNFYFPHHCVIKPDSSSTKLRVVFDGSAKTTSGKSLNSLMMVGPVVQNDLFSILVRFRSHAYAVSADIVKMYRQIRMHDDDQKFQLILWRNSPAEPLSTFKLKTVTYGTSSAPFLATRCLKQLALDHKGTLPVAANVLERDIYVDDLLTGTNSIDAATELRVTISNILQSAGMELKKWCTNCPEIIRDIPTEAIETFLKIEENDLVKTLGLFWNPSTDKFNFVVNFNEDRTITKRTIFSDIARIYDPLGLLAPVVVLGKLLMQSLWQLKLDWDQSLPQKQHTYWQTLRENIKLLNNFTIDRHLFSSNNVQNIQLHGFGDASERAYGAVLYVRSSSPDGKVSVKLLCSKSRVAPLQQTTLPRLELCAAVLLAQLGHKIHQHLNFHVNDTFYWSDSTITLHWIMSCPSKWKTFIANRVTIVQEKSKKENWLHVPTDYNPADLISRGVIPEKFIQSDLWLHGPAFLLKEPSFWPTMLAEFPLPEEMYEMRKAPQVAVVSTESSNILQDIKFHNDFRKLRRVIAYMLRLKVKSKFKFSGPLKLEELDQALFAIVRIVQRECFPVEYNGLEKAHFIVRQPQLRSLSLFLDSDHIIRVGGRLQHTALPYTSKHPILLSNAHQFTLTLINFYHRKLLHAGPRALLAAVRQSYWPLYGTTICKKVVRECKECFRARPTPLVQSMGDLPPERVTASPPFYTVGVDFAGPFYVHYRIRGKPPTKTYLCLFICFVTKAIHLELASDLSSESFMGCFKRFVATRGLCKRVFSDNGTNFVGANSKLRELYAMLTSQHLKDELQSMCEEDQIEWRFTPPTTPHFGGLHEAGVKLAKFHLRRTMGVARFTYEQFITLIKQVEAVLNSRPLGPLTNSLDDIDCLTPGHFLIGRPLNALPMPHLTDRPPLDTWKQIEFYHRIFWRRWSTEYLRSLQQRTKWTKATQNLAVGELVVLIDENQPPLRWKLGRVIKVYNGHDGLVRVADVKTANGTLKRGIAKICRLPQENIELSCTFQGGENVHASTTKHTRGVS